MVTEYLYHFYIRYGNLLAFKYCQGTKQQSYTAKITKILPIIYPPKIEEQKAIAQILSDMDKEIETLKTKLKKTKNIKIGMMQELLTGKTRLK
jgi:type I restriction enzyme S subunit